MEPAHKIESSLQRIGVDARWLRRFDLYSKVDEDFQVQTTLGAALSVLTWVLIAILLMSELGSYAGGQTTEHLVVETTLKSHLRVNLNMSFHALTCAEVQMDAMDVSGYNQVNVEHDVVKWRLSKQDGRVLGSPVTSIIGNNPTEAEREAARNLPAVPKDYCGSCYGAETAGVRCCNNCEELKMAFKARSWSLKTILRNSTQCMRDVHNPWTMVEPGEGCRVEGFMMLNKVAGNFHMAFGDSVVRDGRHIHQFVPEEAPNFNCSHTIHSLSFGERYGTMEEDPLNGKSKIIQPNIGTGLFQYFIRVIPTEYKNEFGLTSSTNAFTATERFRPITQSKAVLPGIFFVYDLAPFRVQLSAERPPLSHILSRLCAIVGGVHALIATLDAFAYRMQQYLAKGRKQ